MIKNVYDQIWACYLRGEVYPIKRENAFNHIMRSCMVHDCRDVNKAIHDIKHVMYFYNKCESWQQNPFYDPERMYDTIRFILSNPKEEAHLPTFTWLNPNAAGHNIGAVMPKGFFKQDLQSNLELIQRLFPNARITKSKLSFRISLPNEHFDEFQEIFGNIHYHPNHTKSICNILGNHLLPVLAPICMEYLKAD
jgi:hypothetical protein